ncbi:MAG: hypothetical protein PGN33_23530 [Methylobacterium radiotolerans]
MIGLEAQEVGQVLALGAGEDLRALRPVRQQGRQRRGGFGGREIAQGRVQPLLPARVGVEGGGSREGVEAFEEAAGRLEGHEMLRDDAEARPLARRHLGAPEIEDVVVRDGPAAAQEGQERPEAPLQRRQRQMGVPVGGEMPGQPLGQDRGAFRVGRGGDFVEPARDGRELGQVLRGEHELGQREEPGEPGPAGGPGGAEHGAAVVDGRAAAEAGREGGRSREAGVQGEGDEIAPVAGPGRLGQRGEGVGEVPQGLVAVRAHGTRDHAGEPGTVGAGEIAAVADVGEVGRAALIVSARHAPPGRGLPRNPL